MKKSKDKLMIVFFAAWFLCGCSVEQACDDPKALAVTIATALIACSVAWVLGESKEE